MRIQCLQLFPPYFIPKLIPCRQVKLLEHFLNISGVCLILFMKMLLKLVPTVII